MPRKLSDWISSYLTYTSETEPPRIYNEWAAVSILAACLRRRVYLSLGREIFYPNFYIVLVGPPAARKGTAMKSAQILLGSLNIPTAADMCSLQKLIQKMRAAYVMEFDEKTGISLCHSSMTIFSTELTVFLGYQQQELITTLCKMFDCEEVYKYETIGRGDEHVQMVWLNLFGATTPAAIRQSLPPEAIGGGFTSRTIFVYAGKKSKVVVIPPEMPELKEALVSDLNAITMLCGQVRVDDGFIDAYTMFRHLAEENPPFEQAELASYVDRRQVHLLKLAMIMSISRGDEMVIRREDFDRALELLERTERDMPKVFQGMGKNPLADTQTRVLEFITTKGETSVQEILDVFQNDLTLQQVNDVIDAFSFMGYCTRHIQSGKIEFHKERMRR